MANRFDDVLAAVTRDRKVQERTTAGMRVVLEALARGATVVEAAREADVNEQTVRTWRTRYEPFAKECRILIAANRTAEKAAVESRRRSRAAGSAELVEDRQREGRPGLAEFRWEYFGRPTPEHHVLATEALEDQTNLYVFILGPTGMGKDTLAGDYVAWESAPDTQGKRVAWFMESEDFSARRISRLARYLTDPKVYEHLPMKTPGGQVPTRSLIKDYGPFKWEKGMTHPDGTAVERTQWDRLAKYFVRVQAPEQDPNLWATGIEGATYGSRISVCVMSDCFTRESQRSPTRRMTGYEWVESTLDTRLDEDGRLVVIGTMLPEENNYERMIVEYTAGARVVDQKTLGTGTLTKYSNGVCVVVVKAIGVDANTGDEFSYWPDRFPLDTEYHYKGKVYLEADLSVERIKEIAANGARMRRGLRWRRERSPVMFKAMYQQERDRDAGGDFTQETLERAENPDASYGVAFPNELIVVGADPAKRYGAAWAALAVDRRESTVRLVDFGFYEKLGITGIKKHLILEPINKWDPVWFIYEDNKESAVLDDSLIKDVLQQSGVSVDTVTTTGSNRSGPLVGDVGSVAAWMRTGHFQLPTWTAEDRARTSIVKAHFEAWDSDLGRSKPGQSGHSPDDIAMAIRAAFLKARVLIEKGRRTDHGQTAVHVPVGVRQRFDRARKVAGADARSAGRSGASAIDLVAAFIGGD